MMSRSFVTAGPDGTDWMASLVAEVNKELADRGAIGDSDATDMSFDVSFTDAVATLGGTWEIRGDTYYAAFGGYPIERLMEEDK